MHVDVVIGEHIVNIQNLGSWITILENEINQKIDGKLIINEICKLHKYPFNKRN